jgi:phosphotriesterase-related protein
MWNPESYRDSDFGLESDETFEPSDDWEEEYWPEAGDPFVMTVLGPVRPDEVGVTLVREHLQWRPHDANGEPDAWLNDPMAALQDLEAFFTVSGRTLVSATPAGAGRDARALVWLARRAPVHIVGATGFIGGADPKVVRDAISRDLEEGMDGTPARPGIFVVGEENDAPSTAEGTAIEEVVAQWARHDLPVMSLAPAQRQRAMVERLDGAGVPAGRVIVSGAADLPPGDDGPLVNAGAWLLFDGIGASGEADQRQARRIVELASEGGVDRIVLSHGYRRRSLLTGYQGRPGYAYFIEQFAVMLLEEGLEALDVRRMVIDNAVAALTSVAATSGARHSDREG